MPELPEVETIVRELRKKVTKRTFSDVWTDTPQIVKKPQNIDEFKKEIKGKTIENVWRRGKNIIFDLSENKSLLIHQKLTGHLLFGYWVLDNGCWKPKTKGPLEEKINTYIHLLFILDNNKMLALSDVRKFAKVELWEREGLLNSKEFKNLGPEPLDKRFTFQEFKKVLPQKGKIKQVLMDQSVIAGIGNIYSDEILWEARVHPLKNVSDLSEQRAKDLSSNKKVLKTTIALKGESFSDFRRVSGEKEILIRKKGLPKRRRKMFSLWSNYSKVKIGGRSAHFCPLYNSCRCSD